MENAETVAPSIQEMLNRAVRGLASQDWKQSRHNRQLCSYRDLKNPNMHCAWGWVDLSLTDNLGSVEEVGCGIALLLNKEQMEFAMELQGVHDCMPAEMKLGMSHLCDKYLLTWPEDVKR